MMSEQEDADRRDSSERFRRRIAAATALIGLALVLSALAQPLKSQLGQSLLESTFDARLAANADDRADADRWRPWPWADLAPIGELNFPELGERRVIADSASGEALAWGVGHMVETAELGSPGVSVVAGHRDGSFGFLDGVHEGETLELTTLDGETRRYLVAERLVVDSRYAQLPVVHSGPDELILTTCWPIEALTSGPERLVIRARPAL